MNNLKKLKILITGSSRGIGLAIARKLSQNKNNLIYINGRNQKKLLKVKKEIKNCHLIKGDITNEKALKKISNRIKDLDVLICNIGDGKSAIVGKEKKIDWEKSFNSNFYSAVDTIKAFEKKLIRTKGTIVCISSICGLEYIKGAPITYSVSKAALNTFVRSYSKFLGPKGVKINAIAPGNILFKGSSWEKKLKKNKKKTISLINNEVSLQKFGSDTGIANLVNYLIEDDSKFINGSIFVADGGQVKSF